ncbi:MAG: hypothetical protein ACYDA4_04230 [Ignavibacteriaceae bacterium]
MCKLAFEKGGIKELKTLLSFGPSENDLYLAVEKVFGVKREDFNSFIRKKLSKYSE